MQTIGENIKDITFELSSQ